MQDGSKCSVGHAESVKKKESSSTNIDKLGVASSDVTSCRCGPRAVTSQEATPTFSILVLELSCYFLHPSLQRDKLKCVCFNLVAQPVDLL